MRTIKGEAEYKKWRQGLALTPQEAINANCFVWNSREDAPCNGELACTLYAFSPFPHNEGHEQQG